LAQGFVALVCFGALVAISAILGRGQIKASPQGVETEFETVGARARTATTKRDKLSSGEAQPTEEPGGEAS
jgi:hypothetical protein